MSAGLRIAVVGLGFGEEFVPIYLAHPEVADVVLVDPDEARRRTVARRYGLADGHADQADVLGADSVDAVHVLAPVALHADMVVAALQAGKHVASAVPMATSLEDCDRVIAAQRASGCAYMMMETTVFAREYFTVERMYRRSELGALTLYRGFHIQNLDGFPRYWQGFPPMHYVTHALSPMLALLGTDVESVRCLGTGRLAPARMTGGFDNPYPTEVGLFTLRGSDVVADITMSFFQTARSYVEGFAIYGEHRGVEWPIDNEGPLTVYDMTGPPEYGRGNQVAKRELDPPDELDRLPAPLRGFVRPGVISLPGMPAPARIGAAHGGSHPHLVHEFVSSIVENRQPLVDAQTAARWTAPGICAHRSALADGTVVDVPAY
jgi:predicted dehydrogenase